MVKKAKPFFFFLWYDNGSGYFDCASKHNSLADAVKVARQGWQPRQRVSTDKRGRNIVWRNYE